MSEEGRVELKLVSAAAPIAVGWELGALRGIAGGDGGPSWRLEGDPIGTPLLRVVSAALEDGTAIGLAAAKPAAATGHGDEELAGFIARLGQDPRAIREPRLSTEYDAEGTVRRAGVELWLDESGPPARGAGDRELVEEVDRGGLAGEAVRMAFRLDGVPGRAVYELLRPAG